MTRIIFVAAGGGRLNVSLSPKDATTCPKCGRKTDEPSTPERGEYEGQPCCIACAEEEDPTCRICLCGSDPEDATYDDDGTVCAECHKQLRESCIGRKDYRDTHH